ncbi:MAG: hypothetical protein LIO79_02680 [Rikenellaceae bacterium]|nr:hypothetical protein [Rikenellaceae bacterium]
MNMRLSNIKALSVAVLILCAVPLYADDTGGSEKYQTVWNSLIPRYAKAQFAGSIGVVSFGTGWNYSKDRLETDILFGFLPKFADTRAKVTFTVKQNYLPWQVSISDKWYLEPLNCGLFMNALMNKNYWVSEPVKYPAGGYYRFSTKVRFHIFAGQRFTLRLNKNGMKSVTGYYEISSCDLYIISAATNKYLKPKDYLSLSFGLKLQIL